MMITNIIIINITNINNSTNQEYITKLLGKYPIYTIVATILIAPLTEELIFRLNIRKIFKNKWLFIILSFLLFGGVHVISSAKTILDYLYIIPYGALGAAFAYSYYKTNNLFTSITLHMFHNIILILISILIH